MGRQVPNGSSVAISAAQFIVPSVPPHDDSRFYIPVVGK